MATPLPPTDSRHALARQVRERFAAALEGGLPELALRLQAMLAGLASGELKTSSVAGMQLATEADRLFQVERAAWVAAAGEGWRGALAQALVPAGPAAGGKPRGFALEDDAVVERKILASRLAAAVSELAGRDINNLKLRIQRLERSADWPPQDVLRPDALPLELVKAWEARGLTPPMWALVQPALRPALARQMADAYHAANEFLVEHGVMAEIDLKELVKRDRPGSSGWGSEPPAPAPRAGTPPPARPPQDASLSRMDESYTRRGPATETPYVRHTALARAAQEPRMMTGVTPMARIRQRAQGVLGQLRRMLTDRVADYDLAVPAGTVSPALASALAQPPTPFAPTQLLTERAGGATGVTAPVSVEVAAQQLRRRATELKAKANKSSEKAIIEIVALMFQAILAEERIPATLRVWFARLQIPVLRLALAEPDFFASTEHPARQLIDRMGACAMGFDAQGIAGTRLEREIKRIVQVIEQYPETGRRVFQLVFDEFKKFLGRSLTEGGATQHAVTLAQQVEQKEALAIQYTIELRKMLASMPVSDDVRDFLLHVWSEVLAMATVRHGPQHQTTLAYKRAAADVLWAISPKPDRAERSSVVQRLPQLLQALREGMATVGIEGAEQDGFVKQINDAVMQAFVSRGEGIAPEKLDELAQSLAGLEDIVPDDAEGDVLLDPDTLELMFGVDASSMKVIAAGGSQPGAGMLAWAAELELGNWFSLEFGGATMQVQYVWRSARGQLHLFAHAAGQTYLVQTTRLASYLQAGMLVPLEDEALTVRATRDALARLDATPDQLLH